MLNPAQLDAGHSPIQIVTSQSGRTLQSQTVLATQHTNEALSFSAASGVKQRNALRRQIAQPTSRQGQGL